MICTAIVTSLGQPGSMTFDMSYFQDCRTHGILTFMKHFCCIGDLSSVRSGQKDNFNRANGTIFHCLLIGGFALYFKDTVTCGNAYRTKH